MYRFERSPTTERQRWADGDAVESHVEIGARKSVAVYVAGYDGGASADCFIDFFPIDLLGASRGADYRECTDPEYVNKSHVMSSLPRSSAPSPFISQLNVQAFRIVPANRLHKDIHVARSLGAEVHVIRVLVHIERQNRCPARQSVTMVGCPLINELVIARRPCQQHPSGATAQSLTHGDEL